MLAEQKSLQYQVKTPDFQGVHLWDRQINYQKQDFGVMLGFYLETK
jgi:hypothetical protein